MSRHCWRSPRAARTRSAGSRVALSVAALFCAVALDAAPYAMPVASAADCADAEVVFARGTDEPKGMGRVGDAFADSLRKQAPGLNIDTYAVDYNAGKLQLHGGDGAKDAISHIKSTVASCPNTMIVLGGYSQGANVVNIVSGIPIGGITWGDPLPPSLADNVAAVATFGNFANRAGDVLPSQSALFSGKAIDLCNPADPICHAGPGNEWSGHTEGYVPAYTTQAAAFAASKLLAGTSLTVPGYGQAPGYSQFPGYASTPPGSQHMPPGYGAQTPDYPSTPGYDPTATGYNPSVVTGLP
ncbi:cutinase family protein [Mycolicibacterium moriokaense]|nr:cutinase family protein [Mycolicibacterium moriokaense]